MTKKTSRPGKVKSGGPKEGLMGRINRLIPKGILYPPLFFPSVLLFLEEEPTHGYELAKRLGEAGIVAPDMDPSVLYKLLRRLEEFDMAVSDHVEESG